MDLDIIKEVLINAKDSQDIDFITRFFDYVDSRYVQEDLRYDWVIWELGLCPDCFHEILPIKDEEILGSDGDRFITQSFYYCKCENCHWEL